MEGEQVRGYQLLVIAKAIEFYIRTGMIVNRGYTPKRMLRVATSFTGQSYKTGKNGLRSAMHDLEEIKKGMLK